MKRYLKLFVVFTIIIGFLGAYLWTTNLLKDQRVKIADSSNPGSLPGNLPFELSSESIDDDSRGVSETANQLSDELSVAKGFSEIPIKISELPGQLTGETLLASKTSQNDKTAEILRRSLIRSDALPYLIRVVERLNRVNAAADGVEEVVETQQMVAGHVLMGIAREANSATVIKRIEGLGFQVKAHPTAPLLYFVSATTVEVDSVDEILDALADFDPREIRYSEPDYLASVNATPNDPLYQKGLLWGLHNTGLPLNPDPLTRQAGGVKDADLNGPEAWDIRREAPDVIVAVIDTGILYTHEDLTSNMWVNPGEIAGDGIDNDDNGIVDDVHGFNAISGTGNPTDDSGHGTHVAGTIGAAGDNGLGVTGVAWKVQLMGCKALGGPKGEGSTADIIQCVDYALANNAHVINLSLGGGAFSHSAFDAYQRAQGKGVLVVAAAGNNGRNTDLNKFFPANYELDNIVSVGNHNYLDIRSASSNFGEHTVDLFAPGEDIHSTSFTGGYEELTGTSMAAPHVSGVLALLKAHFPNESYLTLRHRILGSTTLVSSYLGLAVTGGRLNLLAALELEQPSSLPEITRSLSLGDHVYSIGDDVTLKVEIAGEGPFKYEWKKHDEFRKNGYILRSGQGASIKIVDVTPTDAGIYTVAVSNAGGTVASQVSVQVRKPIPGVKEALGVEELEFFSTTTAAWLPDWGVSHDGSGSLSISDVNDRGIGSIETSFHGPGTLSFWWKVSSEWNYDFLSFYISDGITEGQESKISGDSEWQRESYFFDQGTYRVRWSYEKDHAYAFHQDKAWVDQVVFERNGESPPRISEHPKDVTLEAGATASFAMTATGTPPLTYQWKRNGQDVAQATASNLELLNVSSIMEGEYTVVVSNNAGSVESRAASLILRRILPRIVRNPVSLEVKTGDPIILSLDVVGSLPLRYAWYKNGSQLEGQKSPTLAIDAARVGDSGIYTVTVSNSVGTDISEDVLVTVTEQGLIPTIVKQPASQVIQKGQSFQLLVEAGGVGPFTYQWYKGDSIIEGAVRHEYLKAKADQSDAGSYFVSISNSFGVVASAKVDIIVRETNVKLSQGVDDEPNEWSTSGQAPWIVDFNQSYDEVDSVRSGDIKDQQSSSIHARFEGPGLLTFRWKVSSEEFFDKLVFYLDKDPVDSLTGEVDWTVSSLVIPEGIHALRWEYIKDETISEGMDAGFLDTVAFDSLNQDLPLFTKQPNGLGVIEGSLAVIDAEASGGAETAWQWFKDGEAIDGATTERLVFDAATVENQGSYHAVITNGLGTIDSRVVTLAVYDRDAIVGVGLDQTELSWFNDETNPWTLFTSEDNSGGDALITQMSEPENDSTILLLFDEGPALISFRWRLDSNNSDNYILFGIDRKDVTAVNYGGNSGEWTQVVVAVDEGVQELFWHVGTDQWGSEDRAWIDEFTVLEDISDYGPALDFEGLPFEQLGDVGWVEVVEDWAVNGTHLRSNGLSDGQTAGFKVEINVQETSAVSFDWRMVSGINGTFDFFVDGVLRDRLVGDTNFNYDNYFDVISRSQTSLSLLKPGSRVLEWRYSRLDTSPGWGVADHAGVIDNLTINTDFYTGSLDLGETLDTELGNWSHYNSPYVSAWSVSSTNAFTGSLAAEVSGDFEGRSVLETEIAGGNGLSFHWRTESQSGADSLSFRLAAPLEANGDITRNYMQSLKSIGGLSEWRSQSFLIPDGEQRVSWMFERLGYLANEASAGLDAVTLTPLKSVMDALFTDTDFEWKVKGDLGWTVEEGLDGERESFLTTGNGLMGHHARLEAMVHGPGALEFSWMAQTGDGVEGEVDGITVYIDGTQRANLSGDVDWKTVKLELKDGMHAVAWEYSEGTVDETAQSHVRLDDIIWMDGDSDALFVEDFEGVTLRSSVDEPVTDGLPADPASRVADVWTSEPPTGWTVKSDWAHDDGANPDFNTSGVGVTEWKGWSFAKPDFWNDVAGQDRHQFTLGTGVIAIADGDEWDDTGDPEQHGPMQTVLTSPSISIADATTSSLAISFDSSWRQEEPQIGWISVSFEGGEEIELLKLNSASGSLPFKESNLNETIELAVNNPEGAKEMKVSFGYQAVNDWWWAIDNLRVTSSVVPGGGTPPVLPPIPGGGGNGIRSFAVNGDGSVTIIFQGALTGAATVDGPYLPIPGAASPYVVNPGAGGEAQFYIAQ